MDDLAADALPRPLARWFRAARMALRCAAPLVPAHRRADWQREWEAEIWHDLQAGVRPIALAWRLLGVVPHALWLRRSEWRLDMIAQDLKYAWRNTTRHRGFATIVTATLTLGIGASAAMFTIVNSVLIQPLPYRQAEQLIYLNGSFAKSNNAAISPPDFLDYRAGNMVFSSLGARAGGGTVVLGGTGDPERVTSAAVTANYFGTLGVAPFLGRAFLPEEDERQGESVGLLSYGLWRRRFGSDPKVIGRKILVDGQATAIVGVMPAILDRTLDDELWQPLVFHTPNTSTRRFHFLSAIGRLKPGVTLQAAQAAMDVIATRLAATYPENETWHLRLRPYRDVVVGNIGRALVLLLGAVGVVLLIACANVASLLMARATSRQGEITIRTVLGASRTRLVRQLLTEALLFSLAGGVTGLALASVLVRAVRVMGAGILPRVAEITIDPRVLLFTALVSLATGILFGIAPALHSVRRNLAGSLSSVGRGGSAGRGSMRVRDVLVVGQVALSLLLLVGAGLLLRSLWELRRVNPGFTPDHVLTAEVAVPGAVYRDTLALRRLWVDLTERARAIPGVVDASATTMLPLLGGSDTYYWIEGRGPTSEADRRNAMVNVVADRYFETMRIPLIHGRSFGASERADGPHAVIVSRSMAEKLFPGETAVGKHLVIDFGHPFPVEIAGVAGDVLSFGLNQEAAPTMYFSVRQVFEGAARPNIVVRTRGDPAAVATQLRTTVKAINPDVALANMRTMDDVVGATVSDLRFQSQVLGGFALAALMLAALGLYGVLAYLVNQRSRELGVRMALGAGHGHVFGIVLGRGMALVGIGIGAGLLAAIAATRLIAALLFQIGPADPSVFAAATLTLAVAGLVACVLPALRAARIDPQTALRAEP